MPRKTPAERFKAFVKENGLTYEVLAARTGLSSSTLNAIANGKTRPQDSSLLKLITGVPEVADIFGGVEVGSDTAKEIRGYLAQQKTDSGITVNFEVPVELIESMKKGLDTWDKMQDDAKAVMDALVAAGRTEESEPPAAPATPVARKRFMIARAEELAKAIHEHFTFYGDVALPQIAEWVFELKSITGEFKRMDLPSTTY